MKALGIAFMVIGVIFGILHIINKNEIGILSAGLAFTGGLAMVIVRRQ